MSSLAYALSLTTGFTVGLMTFSANVVYLILQNILNKTVDLKENLLQLLLSVLFGLFINLTLAALQFFITDFSDLTLRISLLVISLPIVAVALLFLFTSKLPILPYDGLVAAMSNAFKWKMGKAKIIGDMSNVILSAVLSLLVLKSFGSIGIGTLVAALFIGKILGFFLDQFQKPLENWVYKSEPGKKKDLYKVEKDGETQVLEHRKKIKANSTATSGGL